MIDLNKIEWLTLALSSLGALWIALILTGVFAVVIRWAYAKMQRIPDTIPEMWPEL